MFWTALPEEMRDKPFTFSYMIHMLHKLTSKAKSNGAMWSPCGRKMIITDRGKIFKAIGKRRYRKGFDGFLDRLKKSGFINEEEKPSDRAILVHPCFRKDREDLLPYFTYKNEFCFGQGIFPQSEAYKSENRSDDSLKLELFDLDMRLSKLHNDCADLNLKIQEIFQSIKNEIRSINEEEDEK